MREDNFLEEPAEIPKGSWDKLSRKPRQIKFRGISVHSGKWVYGYYSVFTYESQGGDYARDDIGHFIMPIKGDNEQREEDEYVRVRPESVGQFTGVRDKNSVEIYVSDIVEGFVGYLKGDGYLKKGYPQKVRQWLEVGMSDGRFGNAGFYLQPICYHPEDEYATKEYFYRSIQYALEETRECELKNNEVVWTGKCDLLEVIGSIHTHPELIKEKV